MREPRDEGDIAQEYQTRHNAAALADHQAKMAGQAATPSLLICADCGDDITEDRREAVPGCTRCADCQTVVERMRKRGRCASKEGCNG